MTRAVQGVTALKHGTEMRQVLGGKTFIISRSCAGIWQFLFPHPCDQKFKASQVVSYSSHQLKEKIPNGKQGTWNYWSKWMQCRWKLGVCIALYHRCWLHLSAFSMLWKLKTLWPSPQRTWSQLSCEPPRLCEILTIHNKMALFPTPLMSLTSSLWWKTSFLIQTGHSKVMELHFKFVP